MHTIASQIESAFRDAIRQAFNIDADPIIVPSQNDKFGDYQSNASMGLAKKLPEKTNPRAVAEQVLAKLDLSAMVDEKPTIAGPGFINVRLSPTWLSRQLAVIAQDARLGVEPTQHPKTVIVEYSAPNIAKQMHVGHIRSTVIGDALARVYQFLQHRVIRQNHIGDWGTQFGKVILAIWHLCMAEHLGEPDWPHAMGAALAAAKNDPAQRAQLIAEIAGRHQAYLDSDPDGDHVFEPFLKNRFRPSLEQIEPVYQFVSAVEDAPEAKSIQITHGKHGTAKLSDQSKLITSFLQKGSEQETIAWKKVRAVTLEAGQQIYNRLGVLLTNEDVRGESFYDPMLRDVVDDLRKAGVAEDSEGATVVFVDGPEKSPLIIEKSAGHGFLYATTDLAAIRYRATVLKANRVLYVVDARQTQHFRQVFETARRAGWGRDTQYEHAAFGTVLGADGKPMKTREGDNIKLSELLDEAEARGYQLVTEKAGEREVAMDEAQRRAIGCAVGIGAIKYADLSKDRTTDYVFSWDSMLATTGNTGPYLQYAYARIRSIFRKAGAGVSWDSIKLESPYELALAKQILRLTDVIELVARELRPHHLCNYLFELATKFSGFYENCPVLQSDDATKASRLALCDLTARTLAMGLNLLGIEHPEQM
ncbi:arginine--tRNA ligase [soil metagenome]